MLRGVSFGMFDVVGFAVAVLLFAFYFARFFKDKKLLADKDPVKKVEK